MQTHSITLGMNISDSGKVTNQMWSQFLETEILERLDYATITDAIGIYKGTVENSKIISVTVDERTTNSLKIIDKLKEIGQIYKKQFRQDTVLYTCTQIPILEFA
jgi:hypothetical protein